MKRATGITVDADPPKEISIHALVKRATAILGVRFKDVTLISIHALVKRATYTSVCRQIQPKFQSTPS